MPPRRKTKGFGPNNLTHHFLGTTMGIIGGVAIKKYVAMDTKMRDLFLAIGENWDTNTKGTKKDAIRKLWRESRIL